MTRLTCGGNSVTATYSYTPGGLITYKGYEQFFWTYGSPNYYFAEPGAGTGYSWDNEGHMAGYGPFTYTLDALGRPTALTETTPGTVWVQNAAYGPGGEMKTMQFRTSAGAYYTENHTFNNRCATDSDAGERHGFDRDQSAVHVSLGNQQWTDLADDGCSLRRTAHLQLRFAETIGQGRDDAESEPIPECSVVGTVVRLRWARESADEDADSGTYEYGHVVKHRSGNQSCNDARFYRGNANGDATSLPATPTGYRSGATNVENRTGGSWYDLENQSR